ncbi:SH3 domain-containing protein [Chitiniphilus eburneus]|uniref:SH3 domain-containing protein n=1 Tax=Chitiniphilus eburneus TaxID=2571148 RepID=A0A4U0PX29_9NEIS|nr:SH3 domain-containing protein [Chitiniphilus eburneus]TJZ73133.1 SH3 domain-containing protein [Chitiniphilus eburneus]
MATLPSLTKSVLLLACVFVAQAATAVDFRSASRHGVLLYQQPQDAAAKLFVVSRGTPLEVLTEQGEWLRVRDRQGSLAWVKKADLSATRQVEVLRSTSVHGQADSASPVVFKAEPGLLLNLLDNARNGWLRVKHQGGQEGFIRIEEVWGA